MVVMVQGSRLVTSVEIKVEYMVPQDVGMDQYL